MSDASKGSSINRLIRNLSLQNTPENQELVVHQILRNPDPRKHIDVLTGQLKAEVVNKLNTLLLSRDDQKLYDEHLNLLMPSQFCVLPWSLVKNLQLILNTQLFISLFQIHALFTQYGMSSNINPQIDKGWFNLYLAEEQQSLSLRLFIQDRSRLEIDLRDAYLINENELSFIKNCMVRTIIPHPNAFTSPKSELYYLGRGRWQYEFLGYNYFLHLPLKAQKTIQLKVSMEESPLSNESTLPFENKLVPLLKSESSLLYYFMKQFIKKNGLDYFS